MRDVRRFWRRALTLGLVFGGAQSAIALSIEAARENCRAFVHPSFVACKHASNDVEKCRELVKQQFNGCIVAAPNAANGRSDVPVGIPKETGPSAEIVEEAAALPTTFLAPPRTITDIAAILDSEKQDPAKIQQWRVEADATVPVEASHVELARFYYKRGNARASLGNLSGAIADANEAVAAARGAVDANLLGRLEQFVGLLYSRAGDPKRAFEIFQRQLSDTNVKGARRWFFNGSRRISAVLIQMGNQAEAEAYLHRSLILIKEARTNWPNYLVHGQSWEGDVERQRAIIFEARGQYRDAENSYRAAELRHNASVKGRGTNPAPESQALQGPDNLAAGQARMKAKQGRLAEAEADARRALLSSLKDQGKYNPVTPKFIMGLADILVEQGRYLESEKLMRISLEIGRAVGVADDSQSTVGELSSLASILEIQHKRNEAIAVYAEVDKAIANWDPQRRQLFDLNASRINSLYAAGQFERGVALAQALVKRETAQLGEKSYDAANARANLAIGYMRLNRDTDAAQEFRAALPILMAGGSETSDDDNSAALALRSDRLQSFVENYIILLNRMPAADNAAVQTFALADAIRGQSVQRALTESSARAQIEDRALAELVRQEQDLTKQVSAQLGTLNNALTLPSGQRDENGVKALNVGIANLRSQRDALRTDIAKRFPNYANLVAPKAPSVDEIKTILKPDEALLSFYFGREKSFVWAVPKEGKVAFAVISATAGDIQTKINMLRKALDPDVAMISEIPPFDLAAAYDLYSLLLKPVEVGWKSSKSVIVVTNGALGMLPLSLLPTAPVAAQDDKELLFSGYRNVRWLARTHAVTLLPSAAAVRTLRQLPPGPLARNPFIGFGDPYFSAEEAADAAADAKSVQMATADAAAMTRGLPLKRRSSAHTEGVSSAELAQLPRLPDTRTELISIAKALNLDPTKVLHLGKDANEKTVETTDLSHYRIIDFATHGLVPGELNGLTQPALALTAPSVAGVPGDGLLTMEKILALKLDADWVVLSACNTAAGAGAGAEAASGLGQAFFYAGTRAILVTNWSVHSASARELVSDLFHRQSADPTLNRAEALRQAMMTLLDSKGFIDDGGKMQFSYGHPLFWAPYTIIGDGG